MNSSSFVFSEVLETRPLKEPRSATMKRGSVLGSMCKVLVLGVIREKPVHKVVLRFVKAATALMKEGAPVEDCLKSWSRLSQTRHLRRRRLHRMLKIFTCVKLCTKTKTSNMLYM